MTMLAGCLQDGRDPVAERAALFKDEIAGTAVEFPQEPLSLKTAIGHALTNNLSLRAAEMELAIAHEVKSHSVLKTLPSLQASLNLSRRDRFNASSSRSLESGRQSLEPSYSAEKFGRPAGLTLVWSLMDLGLGVIRSRQAGERERMAEENLRRLRQQIAMETTVAYCRLRAAGDIMDGVASLEEALSLQLRFNRRSGEQGAIAKTEAAKRAAPLLTGLKTLSDLRKEEQSAKASLAKAMGVTRPGAITLDKTTDWLRELPEVPTEPERLYEIAVANRPEMFTADSEAAISRDEARAALLQMAPNVNLSASLHNNPDRFLVYNNWLEAAFQVSWDLLRFPLLRREAKTAARRAELTALKRRMTAASIMVQVNLALVEKETAAERTRITEMIEENRRVILSGAEEVAATGKGNKVDVLSERLRHVGEYAAMAWARSDYMAAKARLLSVMGVDFQESGWRRRMEEAVGAQETPTETAAPLPRSREPGERVAAEVSLPHRPANLK